MPELSATFFASLLCKFLFCLLNWTISLFTSAINPFGVLVFYFSNCFICGYHPPLHNAAIFSLPPPRARCVFYEGIVFLTPHTPLPHPDGCVFYAGVVLMTPALTPQLGVYFMWVLFC